MASSSPSPLGRMQDEASWSPSPSPGMPTDLQPQRVIRLLQLPGLAKKRRAPTSCIQLQPRALVAYLGRAGSEPQVSRRSSGTRCAQRDAVAAEAERARCSRLMTLSAALRPAPPRAPPRALHPQCNVQSPALPSATPNATPSATSCSLSCPSLP